jgi:hypothetical protein
MVTAIAAAVAVALVPLAIVHSFLHPITAKGAMVLLG